MRAIALLSFWKTRNALRTLFTDPRKLIPAVIIFSLMAFSLLMSGLGMSRQPSTGSFGNFSLDPALLDGGVFIAMILIAIGTIDTGLGDGLLAFGMSDVDYIFPSPIPRRVVLAYRLPALTFGALLTTMFLIYMYRMVFRLLHFNLPVQGHTDPPWWLGPGAVALCVGIYLNLAMFLAIRFETRRLLHKLAIGLFIGGAGLIGLVCYLWRIPGFLRIAESPILRAAFFPCDWASTALTEEVKHAYNATPVCLLLATYVGSLVPMLTSNANYYEQSIASSERVAATRRAQKAGFAAQQAKRASSIKYKSTRTYTVPPFGTGAMALAWAHLCAAAKRPYVNFVLPVLGGIACGILGSVVNSAVDSAGTAISVGTAFYFTFGFMASARTASEAAVRRRDLIAPLPIKAWQSVVANLAVPWFAMFCFCFGTAAAFAAMASKQWPEIAFGLGLAFPLRLAARMVLQYILVLSYPDFADKVQQLIAQGVYYFFAAPLVMIEVVSVIPAILLHSIWLGLITLTVVQIVFLGLLLLLAGMAADRAVATGEPVNLFKLVAKEG